MPRQDVQTGRWQTLLLAAFLALLPGAATAGIVQVSNLAQTKGAHKPGTVIHETRGYWITPGSMVDGTRYQPRAVFRYVYGGTTREGKRVYLRLFIHNLFMEDAARANRPSFNSSKHGPARLDVAFRATTIELLVPTENGVATFEFPVHVVTQSTERHVEVSVAELRLEGHRLRVAKADQLYMPASEIAWLPPREWPQQPATVRLGEPDEDESASEEHSATNAPPPLRLPEP